MRKSRLVRVVSEEEEKSEGEAELGGFSDGETFRSSLQGGGGSE